MCEFSDTPLPPAEFLKTQVSPKTWENFPKKVTLELRIRDFEENTKSEPYPRVFQNTQASQKEFNPLSLLSSYQ